MVDFVDNRVVLVGPEDLFPRVQDLKRVPPLLQSIGRLLQSSGDLSKLLYDIDVHLSLFHIGRIFDMSSENILRLMLGIELEVDVQRTQPLVLLSFIESLISDPSLGEHFLGWCHHWKPITEILVYPEDVAISDVPIVQDVRHVVGKLGFALVIWLSPKGVPSPL